MAEMKLSGCVMLVYLAVFCDGDLKPMSPLWGPTEGGQSLSFDGISTVTSMYTIFSCDFGGSKVASTIGLSEITNSQLLYCVSPKMRVPGAVTLRILGNNSIVVNSFRYNYFGISNLRPLTGEGGTAITVLVGGLHFPNNSSWFRPVCYFSLRPETGSLSPVRQSSTTSSSFPVCRISAMLNSSKAASLPLDQRCISAGIVPNIWQSRIVCSAPMVQNFSQCSLPGCVIYLDVSLDGGLSFTQEQRPFFYLPGATLTSISQSTAPFEGGTTITVLGSHLFDVPELSCRLHPDTPPHPHIDFCLEGVDVLEWWRLLLEPCSLQWS